MKQSISVAMMLMVVSLLAAGCPSTETGSAGHIPRGDQMLSEQNFQEAIKAYQQALEEDSDSVAAWMGLAETYVKLGKVQKAADAYRQVLAIDSSRTKAVLKLAEFEMLAGNLDSAREKVEKVLARDKDNLKARFLMAEMAEKQGAMAEAAGVYKEIVRRAGEDRPDDVKKALLGLARMQVRLDSPKKAEASLKNAVEAAGAALEPRLMLFNLYFSQKRYEEAEQALRQLVDTHPDKPDLRLILGKFYLHRRQIEKAEAAFLKATDIAPRHLPAWLVAGKFYGAVDKPDKALKMFQKALDLDPQNIKVMTTQAEFYLENGQPQAARKTIEAILDQRQGYFPARLLKVRHAIAAGDTRRAVRLCEKFLKGNPASDDLFYFKGMAHLKNDDLARAETSFAKAVEIAPDNINARIKLAGVYLRQDKVAQAEKQNREIFSFLNENFNVTLILGNTSLQRTPVRKGVDSLDSLSRFVSTNPFGRLRPEYLNRLQKRFDQVIQSFETLLTKNPGHIDILENIVMIHAVRDEYDIALAKCDRQLERLKNDPRGRAAVYNIKGGLFLVENRIEAAVAAYQQAIQLAPEFIKPYYGLAKCYIINQKLDNAISQYKTILKKNPGQSGPYLMLGILNKMKNNFTAAEAHYRKALSLDFRFLPAINNLAYLLAEQDQNLDEALSLALKAKSLDKDAPYVRDTLGWIYYKKELYEDAVRELSECVAALPENALANYHLGMAYYRQKDLKKARQHLQKALQLDSGFTEARQARETLTAIGKTI